MLKWVDEMSREFEMVQVDSKIRLIDSHDKQSISDDKYLTTTFEEDEESNHTTSPLLPQHSTSGETTKRRKKNGKITQFGNNLLRRSFIRLLLGTTALLIIVALVVRTKEMLSAGFGLEMSAPWSQVEPLKEINDFDSALKQSQEYMATNDNKGYIPFSNTIYNPLLSSTPSFDPTLSSTLFPSRSCADDWISKGILCDQVRGRYITTKQSEELKIDVLWTWVNGSVAEGLSAWRAKVSESDGTKQGEDGKGWKSRRPGAAMAKHFREHDELRYSVRSVRDAFPAEAIESLHLVVNDYPNYDPFSPIDETVQSDHLLAQVPHWLQFNTSQLSHHTNPPSDETVFRIHPLSELFKTKSETEKEAIEWREKTLPSFNSLSVESQIGHLDRTTTASTLLAMCDDYFLLNQMTTSDVSTPLTGPIFRLQRDLLVRASEGDDSENDGEGEWRGLRTTNSLLDKRFGVRGRPYLIHQGKNVDTAMMREVQFVFEEYLTLVSHYLDWSWTVR